MGLVMQLLQAALRQIGRLARWAWQNHHEFVLGSVATAVILLAGLYFLGRLP
jgi:hypothetical protein